MRALIYTKEQCPYCVKAKALLLQHNIDFMEVRIGDDMLREDFIELFPEQKTVPLIFLNGEKVGGYNELQERFNNAGPEYLAG